MSSAGTKSLRSDMVFMLKIIHCHDFASMSRQAADLIEGEIRASKKQFSLALPGGNSITGILKELSARPVGWQLVNAFMADERLVPPTDPESNYRQADELLFSKAQGIHAFPFWLDNGLAEYDRKFMAVTKGVLDLVVLGVGEDGHIASLFPDHPALNESKPGYIEVHNAPKQPSFRVSLSRKAIESALVVVLLFASEGKRQAFEKFMGKSIEAQECPAKIALKAKRVYVFTVFGGANAE